MKDRYDYDAKTGQTTVNVAELEKRLKTVEEMVEQRIKPYVDNHIKKFKK